MFEESSKKKRRWQNGALGCGLLVACLLGGTPAGAQPPPKPQEPPVPIAEGNWAEALATARIKIDAGEATIQDLRAAIRSLLRLGHMEQLDGLLEKVTRLQGDDPGMLFVAAETYWDIPHYGYEVAGEFRRGNQRGGGEVVQVLERDRVVALRRLEKLLGMHDVPQGLRARAWGRLSGLLMEQREGHWSWRLQTLTDLEATPEPEAGWGSQHAGSDPPVNAEGGPLLYEVPESWQAARSDGERWRWALAERARLDPSAVKDCEVIYAQFLESQFGVAASLMPMPIEDLASLEEDETMARLATGVRRFRLPEGHRYLETYRRHGRWPALAQAYLRRSQRGRSAEALLQAIDASSKKEQTKHLRAQLDQIIKPWVQFEATESQPAGVGATLRVAHRNTKKLRFTARRIDVRQLLTDLQERLSEGPTELDRSELQVSELGWRLLEKGQDRYVGEEVAAWSVAVEREADHADREDSIATPLQEPGAYFVEVVAEGGNRSRLVAWVEDTVLTEKPTPEGPLYGLLDAVTGTPIEGAQIELFGYRVARGGVARGDRPRERRIETTRKVEKTDAEGLALLEIKNDRANRFNWLAVATTESGRLAHLGFTGLWLPKHEAKASLGVRMLLVTDRPVYRPGDLVEFKAWIAKPDYGIPPEEAVSPFAHQSFQVEVHDARGEKVWSTDTTANGQGAIQASYRLPEGTSLGSYSVQVAGFGGGGFRVEEYRKPEFEVTIDAPTEPIRLGEPFETTIRADYYYGSPVTGATVRYRVLRTRTSTHWFPPGPWDWLYGSGYGWLGQEATWRADWSRWGCWGPHPPWRPFDGGRPELVAEGEATIGPEGTFALSLDTADALKQNPDADYRYEVTAEVTDASRRTITGKTSLLATREPVRATLWLDRGFYDVGDTITTSVSVRTPEGKPIEGSGRLRLLRIKPGDEEAEEEELQAWDLPADAEGHAELQVKASEPGRYRLVYTSLAIQGARAEAGSLFTIRGPGFESGGFRYNAIELIPDQSTYTPGETVRLLVNTDHANATVLLFVRPANGAYRRPQVLRLEGNSQLVELAVKPSDQPNFFVEGITVTQGKLHTVVRQVVVPPVSRVIGVEVLPSADAYLPGQKGGLKVRLTDAAGEPLVGDLTVAIYDRSLDAIAGDQAPADIREQFWGWQRSHHPTTRHNLQRREYNYPPKGAVAMQWLGLDQGFGKGGGAGSFGGSERVMRTAGAVPMAMADGVAESGGAAGGSDSPPQVTVRKDFADTALWVGSVETDAAGLAQIPFELPESLTSWQIRVWGFASGVRVGQGSAQVVTRKDLMVRLQTPRFLVETDEVTLSAVVHNYLPEAQSVRVRLEVDGDAISMPSDATQTVRIEPGDATRVDWRVAARHEGAVKVRAVAITEGEPSASDAMQLDLPVLVHGAERVESYSDLLGPDDRIATFEVIVPEERRPEATRLELHYRSSLVGAMLDALPYLIEYPHGCTEQTLNRFLPAAIVRHVLQESGVDLASLAPEVGEGPPGTTRSPIRSEEELDRILRQGLRRLDTMRLSDGGWGWFSGLQERSTPHTTAVVVRGLLVARRSGVTVSADFIEKGVAWLETYREEQLRQLANTKGDGTPVDRDLPYKRHADNLDALVQLVLADAGQYDATMRSRLVDDRLKLSPYSLGLIGLALHTELLATEPGPEQQAIRGDRDRVLRNLRQYLDHDEENQTSWLDLGDAPWWLWHGSEFEAHAALLKLLAATEPQGDLGPRIVKYLLNQRRDAARWNSTRDTALIVEAMADYHRAQRDATEPLPMTVEVWLDGKRRDTATISPEAALGFDGQFLLAGEELPAGRHTLEVRKSGGGRLFVAGTLTNFSLEPDLRAAGLELRVERRLTKLSPISQEGESVDARGSTVQTTEPKYRRTAIPNLGELQSGQLVEVELTLTSKNDYEYLLIEDPKPAGFEPIEVRSGYNGNALGAYVEFRDQRVVFYVRKLARGERTVRYRLRAETPGKFAALPTRVSAMYAPDLRGNSDEHHVVVVEEEPVDFNHP